MYKHETIEAELRDRFRERVISADALFLLKPADAVELIREAGRRGLRLAGVEGFEISESGAFMPLQDYSNDSVEFQGTQADFIRASEDLLLSAVGDSVRFQIVFEAAQN